MGRSADDHDQFATWKPFDERYDFPRFEGHPSIYLVAATPRAGSYLLSYLLRGTGQLGAPFEYLHPRHLKRWQERFGVDSLESLLPKLFERRTSPNGWFGIKAHRKHWLFAEHEGVMKGLTPKRLIRLQRHDRLDQAISLALARQTRSWLSLQDQVSSPRYNSAEISAALTYLERDKRYWDEWTSVQKVDPINLYYEELVADPLSALNGVLKAFGLEKVQALPDVPVKKQASELNAEWKRRYSRPSSKAFRVAKAGVKRVLGTRFHA